MSQRPIDFHAQLKKEQDIAEILTVTSTQGPDLNGSVVNSTPFMVVTAEQITADGILQQHANTTAAGTGIKHDQDKPDMSLLSNIALVKVAQVMTFGKRKYTAHNWRGGFYWSRPLAAAARHLFAYLGGEDKDPETGISHLAHCVCCLMFVLEFEDTHKALDDRYKGPNDANN